MSINRSYMLPAIPLFLTLLSGLALSSTSVSADNDAVIDEVNITVPISCTLTGVGMNSHNATISPGTYNSEVGTTTLKASCNDKDGFSIYAIGFTNDTYGDNTLVSTTLSSPVTIATGTSTSGNSQWAMKLTTDSNATYPIQLQNSFGSFHTVPDDYTLVAKRTAATDIGAAATGSVLTTTYQVFISTNQAADTYTGKVKYALVHPSNMDGNTLYMMQDVATWKNSLSSGQEVHAVDERDGKIYRVAKLADGNIWMTQNLDLDIDETRTYTNEDTDIGWNSSTNSYDTASWTPDKSTYATGVTTWDDTNETGTDIQQSYDPGDICWSGVQLDTTEIPCSQAGSHYHLGNYYSFAAAVAMNDISSYTSSVDITQSICPANWTLPKSDWNTVSGSFYNLLTYYNLVDNGIDSYMVSPYAYQAPLYFTMSGNWTGAGTIGHFADYGHYWTNHVVIRPSSYSMGTYSYPARSPDGSVFWNISTRKRMGISVRCVAR